MNIIKVLKLCFKNDFKMILLRFKKNVLKKMG